MVSIELWFNLDEYCTCMGISRVPCLNEVLYYMGKQYRVTFVEHYLGDNVIAARVMAEDMQERAYEVYGEWAEDYLAGENLYELQKIIETWLDDNIPVSFFAVKDVVQKSVTKEMVEEYLKENV